MEEKTDKIYLDINENERPMEIESLCVNCEENGITKLLLTKIPFFKEVILMCFQCEHCGYKNTEIQPGQQLQEKGQRIIFKGTTQGDLSREIVKSEFASIKIKELDFEIPANKKGAINTIEGFLSTAFDGLSKNAKKRLLEDPELGLKLNKFLEKLKEFMNGEILPFEIIIDDPSGNSYIQNLNAPNIDPQIKYEYYLRTKEQLEEMGYNAENLAPIEEEKKSNHKQTQQQLESILAHRLNFSKPLDDNNLKQEVQQFSIPCFTCFKEGVQKMCVIEIPYFKELIVMSFVCEFCGAHSTEVKPGGEISKKGKKITLQVKSDNELKRELFKSDSAKMIIPELDLELQYGTLGSVYSTTEGLIEKIQDNFQKYNPFCGDSESSDIQIKMSVFLKKLKMLRSGKQAFTMIFDDPLDNSFIQNPFFPNEDPLVKVEIYERTYEQNEEFGLNDMKTENYEKN